MSPAKKKHELDLSGFPPGTISEYTTHVCLACIFDIFTKQLGLAPRTAYSEIKRHAPTIEEMTEAAAMRPYFDSEEKNPHCPYCNSAKRWHARFDTYRIEGGKLTDAARRALLKTLPKAEEQFQILKTKSDRRSLLFEWLDAMGRGLDFEDDAWLIEATRAYLERVEPKTDWTVFEGRMTLSELVRRLRYSGHLDAQGITERDQFDVLEKLVEHMTGAEGAVKLYYIVDRRDFLEKVKTVYAR